MGETPRLREQVTGVTESNAAARQAQATEAGEARRRFVDDFGSLYAHYGLALTVGRVFGLLLISDDPLGLEDIAVLLGVSKSGASVAARDLEQLGVARRSGVPGSRRICYEARDSMEPIFEAQFARIRQQLTNLRRADGLLPRGRAKERLRAMIELHTFWLLESEGIMGRWKRRAVER